MSGPCGVEVGNAPGPAGVWRHRPPALTKGPLGEATTGEAVAGGHAHNGEPQGGVTQGARMSFGLGAAGPLGRAQWLGDQDSNLD